jgi:hypothetical protein
MTDTRREDVTRAIDPEAFEDCPPGDWSPVDVIKHNREMRQRRALAIQAARRVLAVLPAPLDAAHVIEAVLEHGPYLDQTACYDGGCECDWKGTETEHEAHRLAAVAEALALPAPPVVDELPEWLVEEASRALLVSWGAVEPGPDAPDLDDQDLDRVRDDVRTVLAVLLAAPVSNTTRPEDEELVAAGARALLTVSLGSVEGCSPAEVAHARHLTRTVLAVLPAPPVVDETALAAALGDVWDDGNAKGLDGWTGPGRGEPFDQHAVISREKAVDAALTRLVQEDD